MYEECHREENKEHCGAKIENITASVSTVMGTCKEWSNENKLLGVFFRKQTVTTA